jgi:ribosome biogenesis protein BMS1
MGDKTAHKKKKAGKKKVAAEQKKKRAKIGDVDGQLAEQRQRNPKAFVNASRGRAKLQRARTADKEQKRMHGAPACSL